MRGRFRTGMAGAACGLAVIAVLTGCTSAVLGEEGSPEESGSAESALVSLRPGECFAAMETAEREDADLSAVPTVPCDEPHDNEAYAVFTVPKTESNIELATEVNNLCTPAFGEYVGHPYLESDFKWVPLFTAEAEDGTRELLCAVYLPGEQVTGSLAGAGH